MNLSFLTNILKKVNPLSWFKSKVSIPKIDVTAWIAKAKGLLSGINLDTIKALLTKYDIKGFIESKLKSITLAKVFDFIRNLKRLNREELLIGLIFGLCFLGVIGWWAVLLAFITSLLWALTGAGYSKLLRRVGVPLAACLFVALVRQYYPIFVSLPLAMIPLSLGYGIPSQNDAGSPLGRFWYSLNPANADVFTRATIYILLWLAFFPLLLLVW